jgi:hypothetical protein
MDKQEADAVMNQNAPTMRIMVDLEGATTAEVLADLDAPIGSRIYIHDGYVTDLEGATMAKMVLADLNAPIGSKIYIRDGYVIGLKPSEA